MLTRAALYLCLLPSIAIATLVGHSLSAQSNRQLTVAQIVSQASNAVIQVVVSDESGNELALGSGFIVSADGKIVTNYHVIEGARSAIAKLANGSFFPVGGVLAANADRDLVLLKVEGRGLPFLTLDSTTGLQVGDHVVAIGSPLGLEGTVSDGIVSALRSESPLKNWIQTTAPVSHGNSGGPLLDTGGNVVGVMTWGVDLQQGQNLNFAIPSEEVKSLLSAAGELIPFDRFATAKDTASQPPDSKNPTDGRPDQPGSSVEGPYGKAMGRLRVLAGAIKQCQEGTDYGNGNPPFIHYSAPLNVVWDVESRQSARSIGLGYIEFVERAEVVKPTPRPCKKRDKDCENSNEDAETVYTWMLSAVPGLDNFRFEFDVNSSGLQFVRALAKNEQEDSTHWRAVELRGRCPDKLIGSER